MHALWETAGLCCFWGLAVKDWVRPQAVAFFRRARHIGTVALLECRMNYLEFEKPLSEIEGKAEELRAMARGNPGMDIAKEAEALDRKAEQMLKDLYRTLTPWQKCQVARHPDRPHAKDYIEALFTEFTSLSGDRGFAEDQAVMGGLARFNDMPVMVIGHEKGNDTKSRIERNFGMARPEGYRKAVRLMAAWSIAPRRWRGLRRRRNRCPSRRTETASAGSYRPPVPGESPPWRASQRVTASAGRG